MLAALTSSCGASARDLGPRERRWFIGLVAVAVALRLAAIAGLFLLADASRPYANFFGDEELFKSRTVWLRNIGLGVPISPADMIYVFDEVGRSSYLYVLAYIQALVGDAPYGNNVLSTVVLRRGRGVDVRVLPARLWARRGARQCRWCCCFCPACSAGRSRC